MSVRTHVLPNIVIIVLDACRRDRMSLYGYHRRTTPFLEEMSRDATVFETAITNAPWTCPSTPSILTGQYPSQHGILVYSDKLRKNTRTVADILKEKGYLTASVDGPWIHAMGLHRGFDRSDLENIISVKPGRDQKGRDKIDTGIYQRWPLNLFYHAGARVGLLEDYNLRRRKNILRKMLSERGKRPFFLLIWMLDTHLPYTPPRPFQRFSGRKGFYFTSDSGVFKDWNKKIRKQNAGVVQYGDEEILELNDLYDSAVYFSDHQIREMTDVIKEEGALDDTMIIITADHGENIGDHGHMDHQMSLHSTLLRVPLIVRYPRLFPRGSRYRDPVETKDIFHTIAHIVEGEKGHGDSYIRAIEGKTKKEFTFGEYMIPDWMMNSIEEAGVIKDPPRYRCFARGKGYKLIRFDDGTEELYIVKGKEKKVDPRDHPDIMSELALELDSWRSSLEDDTKKGIREAVAKLGKRIRL